MNGRQNEMKEGDTRTTMGISNDRRGFFLCYSSHSTHLSIYSTSSLILSLNPRKRDTPSIEIALDYEKIKRERKENMKKGRKKGFNDGHTMREEGRHSLYSLENQSSIMTGKH